MHLYNITLQRSGTVDQAVFGQFSSANAQEIVFARAGRLELNRVQSEDGKLVRIALTETFALVRSLATVRLPGDRTDYLVVGSDAGAIAILQYVDEKRKFERVHLQDFGKTGVRRIVPGQYIAVDPAGRALCIGALEKQKFVYVVTRNAARNLAISSPLEAHKSHTLVYDMVGVDVGYENPIFACIELDYSDADEDPSGEVAAETPKNLTYYELDLGLNHVLRKWTQETDRGANGLIAVPGGDAGPGGVLVLAENWILWENQDHESIRTPIPRRSDMPDERGLLIIAHATHRQRNVFFFLVQSELGDLYKVTLKYEGQNVTDLIVKYFDTVAPAASLCITRNGFLVVAAESGDHAVYQFTGIGEGDETAEAHAINPEAVNEDGEAEISCPVFNPRVLTNLAQLDTSHSLGPLMDMRVADTEGDGSTSIVAISGRSARSSLRILKQGLHVSELAVADMPGVPGAIFTVPGHDTDIPDDEQALVGLPKDGEIGREAYDKYIVVSFADASLVLSIGETVEEVSDSGFITSAPTLAAILLRDRSYLQITNASMRHIRAVGTERRVVEWKPPGGRTITHAMCNTTQAALALAGGEIYYFELQTSGELAEAANRELFDAESAENGDAANGVSRQIAALALGAVPAGRQRAPFLAVADTSNTVLILSLDPGNVLQQLSAQVLRGSPSSMLFARMQTGVAATSSGGLTTASGAGVIVDTQPRQADGGVDESLFLFVGLQNGILQRTEVDKIAGTLRDTRSRFLGPRPVSLHPVVVAGQRGVLALSLKPWLCYFFEGRYTSTPLAYSQLQSGANFCSEVCAEGLVAVHGSSLRVLTIDQIGETFDATTVPLRYTPRKIAQLPGSVHLYTIIESDHNSFSESERKQIAQSLEEAEKVEQSDQEGNTHEMDVNNTSVRDEKRNSGTHGEDNDDDARMDVDDERMDMDDVEANEKQDTTEANDTQEEQDQFDESSGLNERRIGYPIPEEDGKWGSCIRLFDVQQVRNLCCIELENNEAAISVGAVVFGGAPTTGAPAPTETHVLVGVVQGMSYHPRRYKACFVRTYKVVYDATGAASLELVHVTEVDGLPLAIAPFQGKVLIGVNDAIRMYDLGRKKLLRKAQHKGFSTTVSSIFSSGDRVYVADSQDSVHFCKYNRSNNTFATFADDVLPRHVMPNALLPLDKHTVIVADKFGNISVLRLSNDVDENVSNPVGDRILWDSGHLHGAPQKAGQIANYYVGSVVTTLQRATLPGGQECILYGTISGAIGALAPFSTKAELDVFTHLELFLRNTNQDKDGMTPLGRDHISFRGYYMPVQNIIDGDLCESFANLAPAQQKKIALSMDKSAPDIMRFIESRRDRIL